MAKLSANGMISVFITFRSLEIAPDHVHLLIEYDNNHSIAEVARAFKGRSSRFLRQEFPELLKLPSLWTKSYFYETTGKISTAKIKEYIEDPHHWSIFHLRRKPFSLFFRPALKRRGY